jgi:hypothetical protein
MGSTAPNVPFSARFAGATIESGLAVSLLGLAQANPIPNFRLENLIHPVSQQMHPNQMASYVFIRSLIAYIMLK